MDAYDPIDALCKMIERERNRCDSSTITFRYEDSNLSLPADAFFSFLESKLMLLQRSVYLGEAEKVLTNTIDFMCYLGAFRENDRMPNIIKELRSLTGASGGGAKIGHKGPAKQTLERIIKGIGSTSLNDVLDAIEDGEAADISDSASDPAPWIFTGVDRARNVVMYTVRKTSEEKTIAIKTLDNHLTPFR